MKIKTYIAGPYSIGDVQANVDRAIDVADQLAELGFAPYVPHLMHYWHLRHSHGWDFWIAIDTEFLRTCDALLRLPGESKGVMFEAGFATACGIPIFHTIQEVCEWRDRDMTGEDM